MRTGACVALEINSKICWVHYYNLNRFKKMIFYQIFSPGISGLFPSSVRTEGHTNTTTITQCILTGEACGSLSVRKTARGVNVP